MKVYPSVALDELAVPPGEILVSQTDTAGIITYANSAFAEVSGYAPEELVGASHDIVRHPDMPAAVFAGMWRDLKRGFAWQGVLKNRRKDGRCYWVDALVMPLREDGRVAGYLSVRRRASAEAIAEARRRHARLRARPAAATDAGRRWQDLFSIRSSVVLAAVTVMVLLLAGAAAGIDTMARAEKAMGDIRSEAVDGSAAMARIKFLMADNRAQIMLALLGGPGASSSEAGRLRRIDQSRAEIERQWAALRKLIGPGRGAALADDYWAARMRYVEKGLVPAGRALRAGARPVAARLFAGVVAPLYDGANAKADALMAHLREAATARIEREQAHYRGLRLWTAASLAGVLALLAAAGALFLRKVVRPVRERIDDLGRMAEGNLTARIDTADGGEIGQLNRAFAATQAQLQCLLDHLSRDATQVSAGSAQLKALAMRLNDGIDEQHGRIFRIADRVASFGATAAGLIRHTGGIRLRMPARSGRNGRQARPMSRDCKKAALLATADANVLTFLGAEIGDDLRRVGDFLLDHREAMHCLWAAAEKLTAAAADLESSANRFEIG